MLNKKNSSVSVSDSDSASVSGSGSAEGDGGLAADEASTSFEATAGYDFTEQIGHLLRRAYQRHVAIFQKVIPDSQLTAAQFVALCAVAEHNPCSLNDVVRATAIDQGTVRGIVDRLKARGLIDIGHDPLDRRKVLLGTTAAGRKLVREMVPFARQITELTMADLNPAERLAALMLLRKMAGPVD